MPSTGNVELPPDVTSFLQPVKKIKEKAKMLVKSFKRLMC